MYEYCQPGRNPAGNAPLFLFVRALPKRGTIVISALTGIAPSGPA